MNEASFSRLQVIHLLHYGHIVINEKNQKKNREIRTGKWKIVGKSMEKGVEMMKGCGWFLGRCRLILVGCGFSLG